MFGAPWGRKRAFEKPILNLTQRGAAKPRTLQTLTSTINSLFQKQISEDELASLMKGLASRGYISVNDTKVTYALPASAV